MVARVQLTELRVTRITTLESKLEIGGRDLGKPSLYIVK